MQKIIKFFLENTKVNYTLFTLLIIMGIFSYIKIPKEIFPSIELDAISISGSYKGASIDMLDKISVRDIENNIKSIDGIDEISTAILPNKFNIYAQIKANQDRNKIKEEIQDAVDSVKSNFPQDMDDPKIKLRVSNSKLLNIVMFSQKYNLDELRERVDGAKNQILSINGVSDVTVYGDADIVYNIVVDERKLEAYNINTSLFFSSLSSISYLFPLGKTEGKNHYFLSTYNGAKSAEKLSNIIVKINNKIIRLSDVSTIKKTYEKALTLSSVDGKQAINMRVNYGENANTIEIAKKIRTLTKKLSKKEKFIEYKVFQDRSIVVRERLGVVISNIVFGILLLSVFLIVFINLRMSILVVSGILTSFIITIIYLYYFDYSLNIVSLIGLLISLGIVVDDTIIVSENIQQKIEEGMSIKDAVYNGTVQMIAPITVASITTVVAFLPILMMSGTMGKFIQLIPIALSAAIIASLIEVFIFLPIHAKHILKEKEKTTSWAKPIAIYHNIINFTLKNKKSFIISFIILTPLLTFIGIKSSGFQLFPRFDSTTLNISIKANPNTTLQESFKIVNDIEKEILKNKEKWYIDTITSTAGTRQGISRLRENFSYVMNINIEFYELQHKDFFNKYVMPYISFYSDDSKKIRPDKSNKISRKINKFLKQKQFKKKYKLQELSIVRRKAGPPRTDLQIGIVADGISNKKIIKHISRLREYIKNKKGVTSYSDSAPLGAKEIKIKINDYGQMLGISEQDIGKYLSSFYLDKTFGYTFDEKNLIAIKASSLNKNDITVLEQIQIDINNKKVSLSDIATFIKLESFESILKTNGKKIFYVYADVDSKIITATQLLDSMEKILDDIKKDGIEIMLKGEKEQNKQLMSDMMIASLIAMILILITLLYLFNSFLKVGIILSIIPFSVLGVVIGHLLMEFNFSMPSIIGGLGLAGVVINDGIIMMIIIAKATNTKEIITLASTRLRPIILTTVTTLLGLITLVFFPTGQAAIFQPLAISLAFGLFWGTILNLIYMPTIYALFNKKTKDTYV